MSDQSSNPSDESRNTKPRPSPAIYQVPRRLLSDNADSEVNRRTDSEPNQGGHRNYNGHTNTIHYQRPLGGYGGSQDQQSFPQRGGYGHEYQGRTNFNQSSDDDRWKRDLADEDQGGQNRSSYGPPSGWRQKPDYNQNRDGSSSGFQSSSGQNYQGGNYQNRRGGYQAPPGGSYQNRRGAYNGPPAQYQDRRGGYHEPAANYQNRQASDAPEGQQPRSDQSYQHGTYQNRRGGYNGSASGQFQNRQGGGPYSGQRQQLDQRQGSPSDQLQSLDPEGQQGRSPTNIANDKPTGQRTPLDQVEKSPEAPTTKAQRSPTGQSLEDGEYVSSDDENKPISSQAAGSDTKQLIDYTDLWTEPANSPQAPTSTRAASTTQPGPSFRNPRHHFPMPHGYKGPVPRTPQEAKEYSTRFHEYQEEWNKQFKVQKQEAAVERKRKDEEMKKKREEKKAVFAAEEVGFEPETWEDHYRRRYTDIMHSSVQKFMELEKMDEDDATEELLNILTKVTFVEFNLAIRGQQDVDDMFENLKEGAEKSGKEMPFSSIDSLSDFLESMVPVFRKHVTTGKWQNTGNESRRFIQHLVQKIPIGGGVDEDEFDEILEEFAANVPDIMMANYTANPEKTDHKMPDPGVLTFAARELQMDFSSQLNIAATVPGFEFDIKTGVLSLKPEAATRLPLILPILADTLNHDNNFRSDWSRHVFNLVTQLRQVREFQPQCKIQSPELAGCVGVAYRKRFKTVRDTDAVVLAAYGVVQPRNHNQQIEYHTFEFLPLYLGQSLSGNTDTLIHINSGVRIRVDFGSMLRHLLDFIASSISRSDYTEMRRRETKTVAEEKNKGNVEWEPIGTMLDY